MQKRLALLLSLAASILLSSLTPLMADVTNSTSVTITVEEKEKKPRKVTDSFWSVSLLGGVGTYQDYRSGGLNFNIPHQYAYNQGSKSTADISLEIAYQQRINETKFYWGARLSGGLMTEKRAGMHIDVAPTLSYMARPGGFSNSFEAKFGLGIGYRSWPSGSFAFTPQLDAMYWFNTIGVGAYIKYSVAKSVELLNQNVGEKYIDIFTHEYYINSSNWVKVPGWQFGAGVRVAVRF